MQIFKIETCTTGCKCDFLLECCTVPPKITTVICSRGVIYEARRDRPPKLHGCAEHLKIKFKASFNFFMASALRVLEAGFDLNTQGSLVKGSMPFFAGVAAFFNIPASLKFPFFLILLVATPKRDQLFDSRLSDCPAE